MNAAELFTHWTTVRQGLLRALDMLSDEQLAFTPRHGLRSLRQVACHVAEAEEGWFRFAVTRELDRWPEVLDADCPTVDSLKALLTWVHERTETFLATVDAANVYRELSTPWGETFTLSEVTWHVIEHEVHHRGEIYLMLGLLGLEAPEV